MSKKAFEAIAQGLQRRWLMFRATRPRLDCTGSTFPTSTSSAFVAGWACRRWTSPPPSCQPGNGEKLEQGRRRPHGPARVLLVVIDKAPHVVLDAIGLKKGRRAA